MTADRHTVGVHRGSDPGGAVRLRSVTEVERTGMHTDHVRSESTARRISAGRRCLQVGAASLTLMFTLAACGSSSTGTNPNSGGTTATTGAPTTSCTIPQNNGGDHDADNNGAPSDGDGCDI